jgi:alpha-D-ribose 1-methylphosphonate 5-triphosphate synthase subunit PhnL
VSVRVSVDGLRKGFTRHLLDGRRVEVLLGVSLEVAPGSCTVITGESGSGKSSLLRCVHGTYHCDGGSVVLRHDGGDLDIATATDREVLTARRELMGLATQFLEAIPRIAAVDLVAASGPSRHDAAELLRELGLRDALLEAPPATFSGGERQVVNLARALATPRPLLLLDEITASLDRGRAGRALAAVRERKHAGATILAVFHDVPALPGLVDEVLTLRRGELMAA